MKRYEWFLLGVAILTFVFLSVFSTNAVTLLMVPQGGTGAGTFIAGDVLQGNGTGAIQGSTMSGDATLAVGGALTIGADKILESHLKAVDSAADEECLTYESTTGDFEWQTCGEGGGGGDITDVFDCATGDCKTMTVGTSEYLVYGTGYIDANRFAGVTTVDSTEFGYLNGLTAAIVQTGSASHDGFSDFVANEHIDWTADQGATNIHSGNYTDTNTTYTAGRSLTLTTTTFAADSELYHHEKCFYIEDPVAADDLLSLFHFRKAATITGMWCESDQTVNMDLQLDDGTPADINGTDLVCDTTPADDTSLGGDTGAGAGERLDLAITSVSGTPTWVSICFDFTYDD